MKWVKPTKVKYNLNKKTILKNNKSAKNRFKKNSKAYLIEYQKNLMMV